MELLRRELKIMNNYFQNFKDWLGSLSPFEEPLSDNGLSVIAAFVLLFGLGILFLLVPEVGKLGKLFKSPKVDVRPPWATQYTFHKGRAVVKFETNSLEDAVGQLVQRNYGLKTSEIVELLEVGGFKWRMDQKDHREAAVTIVLTQVAGCR